QPRLCRRLDPPERAAREVHRGAMSPVIVIAGAAVALAVGFGSGWQVQGWRKAAEIADLKRVRSDDIARQSQAALNNFTAAVDTINAAARGARLDLSNLGGKLDAIRQDFKNAKPAPLPVDCRPDAVRVHKLTAAAAAVDHAIAGSVTGGTVPAERP